MRQFKKTISILLALLMMLGVFPTYFGTAFAEVSDEPVFMNRMENELEATEKEELTAAAAEIPPDDNEANSDEPEGVLPTAIGDPALSTVSVSSWDQLKQIVNEHYKSQCSAARQW